MVCLDDRRLVSQHVETHYCLTAIHNKIELGKQTGWANGSQAIPFHYRRGALVEYHDDIVLPEMERRGFNHKSPLKQYQIDAIPEEEYVPFWDCVTWREVLRDARHLFEKWRNDRAIVEAHKRAGTKTRVVVPKGQNEKALHLVMEHAIQHVFQIEYEGRPLEVKKQELLSVDLLDPPDLTK